MRDGKRLAMVSQITGLRYQATQLEMAKLLEQERALRRNLEQLVDGRRSSIAEPGHDLDAAMIAGAAIRWHQWVDQRITIINMELAQVLAQKLELHQNLKIAFGKDQAVRTLSKRALLKSRQTMRRRADYVS